MYTQTRLFTHVYPDKAVYACITRQGCLSMYTLTRLFTHVYPDKAVYACIPRQGCLRMYNQTRLFKHVYPDKAVYACIPRQGCLRMYTQTRLFTRVYPDKAVYACIPRQGCLRMYTQTMLFTHVYPIPVYLLQVLVMNMHDGVTRMCFLKLFHLAQVVELVRNRNCEENIGFSYYYDTLNIVRNQTKNISVLVIITIQ